MHCLMIGQQYKQRNFTQKKKTKKNNNNNNNT